eukprot:bmy_06297T0
MAKVRSPECLHLIIKYPLHTCPERLGSGIPQPQAVGQHNGLEVTELEDRLLLLIGLDGAGSKAPDLSDGVPCSQAPLLHQRSEPALTLWKMHLLFTPHLLCGTEVLIMRGIDAKFTTDNSPKDNYILVHHLSYTSVWKRKYWKRFYSIAQPCKQGHFRTLEMEKSECHTSKEGFGPQMGSVELLDDSLHFPFDLSSCIKQNGPESLSSSLVVLGMFIEKLLLSFVRASVSYKNPQTNLLETVVAGPQVRSPVPVKGDRGRVAFVFPIESHDSSAALEVEPIKAWHTSFYIVRIWLKLLTEPYLDDMTRNNSDWEQTLTFAARKAFVFPEESDNSYVSLKAQLKKPLKAFTVCLYIYSELAVSRGYSVFSYATKKEPNEILIFWSKCRGYTLAVHETEVLFKSPENTQAPTHICASWESISGIAEFWVGGKPLVRKSLEKGASLGTEASIILGQEQDIFAGDYDKNQCSVCVQNIHYGHRSDNMMGSLKSITFPKSPPIILNMLSARQLVLPVK